MGKFEEQVRAEVDGWRASGGGLTNAAADAIHMAARIDQAFADAIAGDAEALAFLKRMRFDRSEPSVVQSAAWDAVREVRERSGNDA